MAVAGWLPTWTGTKGQSSIRTNIGRGMDEVNFFWYSLKSDGGIKASSKARDASIMNAVWNAGGEVIPTIYDVSDRAASKAVFNSPGRRKTLVQGILAEVEAQRYDGIDIDFEHIKSDFKGSFHLFLKELRDGLHAKGKILSIAIPGKRAGSKSWSGYDYAAVGALVDRFKIMTYGYSGPWSSKPGPIAPTTWISRVLDFAVTVVQPSKIYIGIPFYGYDWPSNGGKVRSVTWSSAQSKLARSSAGLRFDSKFGEATFTYLDAAGVKHTVWFQDHRAIAAKTALVHKYKVAGIAIWALGYGDRSFWDEIEASRQLATP